MEYNARDYPRGYCPKIQPYIAPRVFLPQPVRSNLRWDVILHDSGLTYLRCRASNGYVIDAWRITLGQAAALERGESLTLRDATLVVRVIQHYTVLAPLPTSVNALVHTAWS